MRTTKNKGRHKFNHQKNSRRVKQLIFISAMLIVMAVSSACSSSKDSRSESAMTNNVMADKNTVSSEAKSADSLALNRISDNENTAVQPSDTDSESAEGTGTVGQIPTNDDRKLIYNANLVMEVKQYEAAKQRVSDIIHLAGGYALQFNDQFSDYERGGQFVFKVPSKGFQSVLDQLNKVDNIRFERNYSAEDVTEEYVDLSSRLKARRVNESRLLAYMESATNTKDLLALSQQLTSEQEMIEQIVGRMRYIDNNVSMSTIELRLYETIKTSSSKQLNATFGERIGNTLTGSLQALQSIGEMLVIIITALAPFLIVLAILAIPIVFLVRRNNRIRGQFKHNRHASRNAELLQQQQDSNHSTPTEDMENKDNEERN